jgi:hypothetical protein
LIYLPGVFAKTDEIVELADHPWFVASQFHPEFRSRLERPHPLFDGFIEASLARVDGREPEFRQRTGPLIEQPAVVGGPTVPA